MTENVLFGTLKNLKEINFITITITPLVNPYSGPFVYTDYAPGKVPLFNSLVFPLVRNIYKELLLRGPLSYILATPLIRDVYLVDCVDLSFRCVPLLPCNLRARQIHHEIYF